MPGLHATIGIQAALLSRAKDGEGRFVDISMNDCAVSLLQSSMSKFNDEEKGGWNHEEPERVGTRGRAMTPFETYMCSDKLICLIAYQRKVGCELCGCE